MSKEQNLENKDLTATFGNTMLGDSVFNVYTITSLTDTKSNYCHWSDGLTMYIQKDNVTIKLNSREIQELVSSLPRTIGGSY